VPTLALVPQPLQTGPTQVLEPEVDDVPETGKPQVAHIVKPEGGDAAAKVLEARIYGYPLEALCGEVFVPQRDPTKLPLCGACKEIYELYRAANDGLDESPGG
jgi:hypothetical protein